MSKSIVRAFSTRAAAETAVRELRNAGFSDAHISLVGKDAQGHTVTKDGAGADVAASRAGEGAAIGAATGAAGGALVTLGLLTGVIPVIGPVVALGWLGTTLLNAAGGAAAIGIAGALTGWGLSEADATYYEGEVAAGRFLVTANDDGDSKAARVLTQHGGYDRATAPKM